MLLLIADQQNLYLQAPPCGQARSEVHLVRVGSASVHLDFKHIALPPPDDGFVEPENVLKNCFKKLYACLFEGQIIAIRGGDWVIGIAFGTSCFGRPRRQHCPNLQAESSLLQWSSL
ncbi:hypothetical protein Tsp_05823 [Trichinella spiralis]|uniref:hypothetical protein n=1 Tax=Trichinella spiralis TaxID=6334 RepID=UPI0001EFC1DC|nr:hypothetical protein Tsp_05823 [Trichinella spiralis]